MCRLLCWLWWLLHCFYWRCSSIAVVRNRMKRLWHSGSCTGPTKGMPSNPDRTNCSWTRRSKRRFFRHPSSVQLRTPVRQ
uniref:Putative secreted protein n=1 Tax=Anopheles triannulatus TaxID=58253 RepID=A0A2M4B324_9DIPT